MQKYRTYGLPPYKVVTIHGGPGAPGSIAPVARELSKQWNIIEPFQTENTINGQVEELHERILHQCQPPVVLIGHSWGAWLAFLYASKYPDTTKKIILISAGVFTDKYNADLMKTRMERLSDTESTNLHAISTELNKPGNENNSQLFQQMADLISKADAYKTIAHNKETIAYQPHIYQTVWDEAVQLRQSGKLLHAGQIIKCPVIAIHGNYDPHSYEGVKKPLENVVENFAFFLLQKCGHEPWNEYYAKDEFYRIVKEAIKRDL